MKGTVLLVDDQELPRRTLASELEDAGFEVIEAADGVAGWERFCEVTPDVIVTDMVMPRSDGLDLLGRIRSRSDVPVILFTGCGTVQTAASAFKAGADDFVSAPDVDIEELVALVGNAVAGGYDASGSHAVQGRLVGGSKTMERIRERVAGLAPLRTPVLVCGEPGTGRNTAIRTLHEIGSSAAGELHRFDPNEPVRAQLPRTGAIQLDDIEHFSPELQSYWCKQVAQIESHGFCDGPRIFASSSTPAAGAIVKGKADPELRAILHRFSLDLPPLRAIPDDIPVIADTLVRRIGGEVGRRVRLSRSARAWLATHEWPGNHRQLARVLERAVVFTRARQIRRDVLEEVMAELEHSVSTIREHHRAQERRALMRVIEETGGNISQTAHRLGRSRSAIYRLIEKYGLHRD